MLATLNQSTVEFQYILHKNQQTPCYVHFIKHKIRNHLPKQPIELASGGQMNNSCTAKMLTKNNTLNHWPMT